MTDSCLGCIPSEQSAMLIFYVYDYLQRAARFYLVYEV